MAFPTVYSQNVLTIQRFANALYNMQVGSTTLNQVMNDAAALGGNDEAFNIYFNFTHGAQSNAMVAETLLANFGIVAGQNGLDAVEVGYARDYIVGALAAVPANQRGAAISDLTVAWAGLAGDATYGAAASAWNAEVAVATSYSGPADLTAGTSVPAHAEFLTVANDVKYGTDGNDTFTANVEQNANGAQANTLGSGDYIYGFGGIDTLAAEVTEGAFLGGGNMPIKPKTLSVENIKLEAQFSNVGFEAFDLNLGSLFDQATDMAAGLGIPLGDILDLIDIVNDTNVYVNAADMDGVDFIGSDHSDADLTIMDLTTVKDGEIRLTSAMTIGMAYTGNSDHVWNESDLSVYFDEDFLLAGQTITESEAFFWLLDEDGHDATVGTANYRPLLRIDREGILFSMNGVPINIIIGELTGNDYTTANTWEAYRGLLEAERVALVAESATDPAYAKYAALADVDITVSYAPGFTTTTNTDTLLDVPVAAIILTDNAGGVFSDLGYQRDPGATGEFDVFGRFGFNPSEDVDLLISVNVELEKVGRGGDGGELVIGGMNKDSDNEWGDGSSLKPAGVEQFDVTVMGDDSLPNSLASLKSTNNALQVVNVVSEAGAVAGEAASLQIGNSNTVGQLGTLAGNANALKDVRQFDSTAFVGDLTLYAGITGEVVDKYMDLKDTQANPADDNIEFNYLLGAGNDYLNVVIDPANFANSFFTNNVGTTTREDFELLLDGGAGDDEIVFMIGDGTGNDGDNWYENSALNANLFINGGAGNDIIRTPGAGNVIINAGTGNDVVYADNTGVYPVTGRMATWVDNVVDRNLQDLGSDTNGTYIMIDGPDGNSTFQGEVTVTFKGFESTVAFTDNNGTLTDLELNQLIKRAVNEDSVLSNLLEVLDGPANSLVYQSLIDGVMDEFDLNVMVDDEVGNLLDYYPAFATYFGGPEYVGVDSTADSDNIITLGLGDDIAVLGTNNGNSSNDTLVYTGAGNGTDTIVNFETTMDVTDLFNEAHVIARTQGAAAIAEVPAVPVAAEIFTLEVTAATGLAAAGGTIIFDSGTVTIAAGATLAQVVAAFITPTVPYATYTATAGATASTITFTETTPAGADIADVGVADFLPGSTPTLTGVLVGTVSVQDGAAAVAAIPAVPATAETFTVEFGNNQTPGDTLFDTTYTFDGEEIPVLTNELGFNIAAAVGNGSYVNWTAANVPGTDTVVFTSKTTGNVADVTDAAFVGANIEVIVDNVLAPGFDMIDFTAYDVVAVVVEGQGVVTGALAANANVIYFNESATNPFEYTVSEYALGANGALDLGIGGDTIVTAIGVIDFGTLSGPFAAENFII